jgi:hypothetical protein
MSKPRRTSGAGAFLLALALAGGSASAALAQEEPPEADTALARDAAPDRERLTQFAQVHVLINEARDEFHGQVARVHDEEGRRRAREEVDARIVSILEEHQITAEEYDAFTLQISLDGELRATFEEVLAALAEQTTG